MKYTVELDDELARLLSGASNNPIVQPEHRGNVELAIAALVRMHVRAVLGDVASRAAIQTMLNASVVELTADADTTKH